MRLHKFNHFSRMKHESKCNLWQFGENSLFFFFLRKQISNKQNTSNRFLCNVVYHWKQKPIQRCNWNLRCLFNLTDFCRSEKQDEPRFYFIMSFMIDYLYDLTRERNMKLFRIASHIREEVLFIFINQSYVEYFNY